MMNKNNYETKMLVERLSLGHLNKWEQISENVNEGMIRTYDALRALEKGLNMVIVNYEDAIKDNADIEYWTNERDIALKVLEELDNQDVNLVKYKGIGLYKK